MPRTVRVLIFALLGPVTGALALGLERSIRQRRHAMAGIYGLAIVESWIAMAVVATHLGAWLGVHLG
jgi:hypothetical protein